MWKEQAAPLFLCVSGAKVRRKAAHMYSLKNRVPADVNGGLRRGRRIRMSHRHEAPLTRLNGSTTTKLLHPAA